MQQKQLRLKEEIIAEFQNMRNEQRMLATKLNTLEMDLKEHKTVIELLKTVDENRKCFRLIGGVLCERTVKEVLPQLVENKDLMEQAAQKLTENLQTIEQINKYKEEH
uniref:Prefoldin subunit 2 n=1 Tax=Megaselia scalaris TaxID=36166 RepID=T1H5P6_MEGSC